MNKNNESQSDSDDDGFFLKPIKTRVIKSSMASNSKNSNTESTRSTISEIFQQEINKNQIEIKKNSENKTEINIRIKRYLKSDDVKFTDKDVEIENIIQAIVNGISVDDKRLFTIDDKRELLAKTPCQDNKYQCSICKKWFYPEELQIDHIDPWSKGGRTVLSNAQLLCAPCNRKKSNN